jgi:hypothetical protein
MNNTVAIEKTRVPFDICRSHHHGNPESVAANAAIHPRKGEMREKFYEWFVERGPRGAVAEEAEMALGFARGTGQPRVTELKTLGKLVKNGERRPTSTGNKAAVLVADVYAKQGVTQ